MQTSARTAPRTPVVATLLFASGACALMYQAAWFRELRLVFGASTAASAAVLGVFMAGLGIGGRLLGARADRTDKPLMMYANLELAVSVVAGITPLLSSAARSAYVGLGGSATLGTAGATVARLLLAALVLAGPTLLMGGTLPAAIRAVESDEDSGRKRVAALYGANTLGAVVGTALASFLLFEVFGTRTTLWIACLLNALVGMTARSLARSAPPVPPGDEDAPVHADDEPPAAPKWFPPLAAAAVGFAFMLMEIVWYRMLAPLLGGSSYTFGLILTMALFGIAVGGALHARGRAPATLRTFALTCALEALFIAIPYALGDRIAVLALLLRSVSAAGFGAQLGAWAFIAGLVVLPTAIVSGAQFPLIIGLYGRGRARVGSHVGHAYLANTVGGIVGSLAGGFGLLPLLTAQGAWKLVAIMLALSAVFALGLAWKRETSVSDRAMGALAAVSAIVAVLCLGAIGPTAAWRHTGVGAGRAGHEQQTKNALVDWSRRARRAIEWEADGVESGVAMSRSGGYAFIVNGKSDGHSTGDAATQVMGGVLASLLHGAAHKSLVVGLGTGSTAGWLAAIPSMERVDVFEIEPTISRVARACAPVNMNAMDNPKLHVSYGDAREGLLVSRERYDVIFSEPSNPFRAGISSLYTREFYEAVRSRLTQRGVFAQWVQAYEIDGRALASVASTLRSVFDDVTVWETQQGDLMLLAREKPEPVDMDSLRAQLATEPFKTATRTVWEISSAEGVLAHFVGGPALTKALAETAPVNTDDDNLLEFAFARTVGVDEVSGDDIVKLSMRMKTTRPEVKGVVDWDEVQIGSWLERLRLSQDAPALDPAMPEKVRTLASAMNAFAKHKNELFLQEWKAADRKNPTPTEIAMVTEAASRVADEETFEAFFALNQNLVEREIFRAYMNLRRRPAESVAALERAFVAHRTYPWVRKGAIASALSMSEELARVDKTFAARLHEALSVPFSVHTHDDARELGASSVAALSGDPQRCVRGLVPLEPHTPWNRASLRARAACYRATGDARLTTALEELQDFARNEPIRVGESISAPPP